MSADTIMGELKLIDGTMYLVRDGSVYKYDDIAESAGAYVGRLCGECIDTTVPEVPALLEQISQLRKLLGDAERDRQAAIAERQVAIAQRDAVVRRNAVLSKYTGQIQTELRALKKKLAKLAE